ncbi:MAG: DUF2849 domain-containing protein [Rhodobacteraceae bacterium]|nr:DUF2849 domain-containing protein [Paracoccaceae bacterium]
MAREFVPQIITSNHLIEGDSIYLTEAGAWSRIAADAMLLANAEIAATTLATANLQTDLHVGAYLADATHFRETFRAVGPSNYFHGKQAV